MDITLPHCFTPRPYQLPVLRALDSGIRRAVLVWHRRAGKDVVCLNYVIKQMYRRVGVYYYLFPTFNQGRKILWDGINNDGFKFIDHFPKELIAEKNETEMQIITTNGSLFQVVGTDDFNKVMGTNPVGLVHSEYALQDPRARQFLLPIVEANGGFELFPYTPRGENHGFDLAQVAQANPQDWFYQELTVDDTRDERGNPIVTKAQIDRIRRDKEMTEETIQQEFYCKFIGQLEGAYYGAELALARKQLRIGPRVLWNPKFDVETWWDIGRGNHTAIWFLQRIEDQIRFIHHYKNKNIGLPHYVKYCRDEAMQRGWVFGRHTAGWDIDNHDYGSDKTRVQSAWDLGLRPKFNGAPKMSVDEGIDAVRMSFPNFFFDPVECAGGLTDLAGYRREWDPENHVYKPKPLHNGASDSADALRNGSIATPSYRHDRKPVSAEADMSFDVFAGSGVQMENY